MVPRWDTRRSFYHSSYGNFTTTIARATKDLVENPVKDLVKSTFTTVSDSATAPIHADTLIASHTLFWLTLLLPQRIFFSSS